MAERLTFTLDGRDNLSRVLDNAGDSATLMGRRIDDAATSSSSALARLTRDTNGRLRDLNGRFVSASDAARLMGGGVGDLSPILQGATRSAAGLSSSLGTAGASGGGLAGAGGAVAAIIGLTLLPAIGALVPMMAGAGLAAGTLALGFKGVGEAAALASGDKKKYAEALKKLSPEAREFTKALVGVKGQFSALAPQIQKVMLPGFTQALKDSGPLVKILGKGMTEMGKGFGEAARGVGRMMKDSGFQKDFTATLKLGNVFVRDLTASMGPFIRSLISFGAASGPTLKAFSDGISGLLGKGLPGLFDGLKTGVQGSASFLSGLFDGINDLLPAIGRFSGAVAKAFGSLFGEFFRLQGTIGSGLLDGLTAALKFLSPVLKDIGYGFKSIHQVLSIIGPTIKDTASAIFGALLPAGDEIDKMRGPFQRLSDGIQNNKQGIQEMARVFANVVIDMVSETLTHLPKVVGLFRVMTTGVLDALGLILWGASKSFGWIPGIGDKLRTAEREFGRFKDAYVEGLRKAEDKTRAFAQATVPKLQQNKLKLNIDNWLQQIATAKAKLSDKNLPPEKRAKLLANIADLTSKVSTAKRELKSIRDETVYVNVVSRNLANSSLNRSRIVNGVLTRAGGGPVRGPGTSTSDSIPMWASDGEYVIRARSVERYGLPFLDALNAGRLDAASPVARAGPPTPRARAAVPGGAAVVINNHITVNGAIDPTSTAEQLRTMLLRLQRGMGLPEGVIMR